MPTPSIPSVLAENKPTMAVVDAPEVKNPC
jgi:hypothetical protein